MDELEIFEAKRLVALLDSGKVDYQKLTTKSHFVVRQSRLQAEREVAQPWGVTEAISAQAWHSLRWPEADVP